MQEVLKIVVPMLITGVVTGGVMGAALIWIAKKLVNASISSQRQLTEGALDDMKANTKALSDLSSGVQKFMIVHQEREKTLFNEVREVKESVFRLERRR